MVLENQHIYSSVANRTLAVMTSEAEKRAAELLLKRATMLNIACPVCNSPIYRLQNQSMYCAYCDKQVVSEKDANQIKEKTIDPDNPIQLKINELTKQLEEETEADNIIKLAEAIKKLRELL